MQIRFSTAPAQYPYRINLTRVRYMDWAYPSITAGRDACVFMIGADNEYAAPPSHELRTLIEAAAPWYVVIDKLIEEYPQWQSHFEAAAAAERQRMEVA